MRREFLKTLGAGAATFLMAQQLRAATPTGPGRTDRVITPMEYGARANGRDDDTLAVIRAAQAAARQGIWLVFPAGEYVITDQVSFSGAMAGVKGENGNLIRLQSSSKRAGFLVRELAERDPIKNPFLVSGLSIECQVTYPDQAAAIYLIDTQGVHVVDNQIRHVQVGHGIYVRGMSNGVNSSRAVAYNVFRNNVIEVEPLPDRDCFGIEIEAERLLPAGDSSPRESWLRRFVLPDVPVPAHDNLLEGNQISGAYYGISFLGVRRSLVQDNKLQGQIRCMSIQHQSHYNVITGNELTDSLSSSIHLAYGSSFNTVSYNRIRNNRARGEGLLQAYVGASKNDFYMNEVEVGSEGLPKYMIYCAVVANENSFWGNRLSGPAGRAYIAVESAFNSRLRRKSHRGYGLRGADDHFTDRGMYGVRIVGNEIRATSMNVPVYVLAQVGDDRGQYPLLMCELSGNQVQWTGRGPLLELSESQAGLLRQIKLVGNEFAPVPRRDQLVLPRGGKHFSEMVDRAIIPQIEGI